MLYYVIPSIVFNNKKKVGIYTLVVLASNRGTMESDLHAWMPYIYNKERAGGLQI